ncbi:unnamed protein product [Meganyctiphanes norvegica]|uniref:RING-type domain-containing protein n=1 Tax=Meganyctiphanes norvegica TaxID=48144 RepID=A0AAV2PIJ1_MEGNR
MQNDLQDDLTHIICPICHEEYKSPEFEPVHLRCGHDICRHCLQGIYIRQGATFPCPLCRYKHDGTPPTNMPINYILLGNAERSRSSSLNSEYNNSPCLTGKYPVSFPVQIVSSSGTPYYALSGSIHILQIPCSCSTVKYPVTLPVNIPSRHESLSMDFGKPSSISSGSILMSTYPHSMSCYENLDNAQGLCGTSTHPQFFPGHAYTSSPFSSRNSQGAYVNHLGTPEYNSKNIISHILMDNVHGNCQERLKTTTQYSDNDCPFKMETNEEASSNRQESTLNISENVKKEIPKKKTKTRRVVDKFVWELAQLLD